MIKIFRTFSLDCSLIKYLCVCSFAFMKCVPSSLSVIVIYGTSTDCSCLVYIIYGFSIFLLRSKRQYKVSKKLSFSHLSKSSCFVLCLFSSKCLKKNWLLQYLVESLKLLFLYLREFNKGTVVNRF